MRYFVKYNEENEIVGTITSVPDRTYDGYTEVTEEEHTAAVEKMKNKSPVTPAEFMSMVEEVL